MLHQSNEPQTPWLPYAHSKEPFVGLEMGKHFSSCGNIWVYNDRTVNGKRNPRFDDRGDAEISENDGNNPIWRSRKIIYA